MALAPMAGITDAAFRGICRGMGADFSYTEMISAKGLHYNNANTGSLLEVAPEEHTYGIQLFGAEPEMLSEAVRRLGHGNQKGLALIDINMGCPAHKIVSNGEGSALMKNEALAGRVIEAAVRAAETAGPGGTALPVSVKFRKGWDESHVNAISFARMAQGAGASLIALHGRTRVQMYSGRADWDIIAEVKQAVSIPVLGNGDVFTGADALAMRAQTGCDGVLIGRGAQGNPFLFEEIQRALGGQPYQPPVPEERIHMALVHAERLCQARGPRAVIEMRKHVAWYLSGLRGSASLRGAVNAVSSLEELRALLEGYKARLAAGI